MQNGRFASRKCGGGESAGREAWERGEKYNTELSGTAIALSG